MKNTMRIQARSEANRVLCGTPLLVLALVLVGCGGGGGSGSSGGDGDGGGGHEPPPPEVFERFDGPLLAAERWRDLEFRRAQGSLRLEQRMSGEAASSSSNSLLFANPAGVQSISVPVVVEQIALDDPDGLARVRARVGGYWYNDGSAGGGQLGDVFGEVRLRQNMVQALRADVIVSRCDNAECSAVTDLFVAENVAPVQVGQSHVLSAAWDGMQITFSVDGVPTHFVPSTAVTQAKGPAKLIGTRVDRLGSAQALGHIVARAGPVSVNGQLYDDFAGERLTIDKWSNLEFERGISDGALVSRIATRDGVPLTNSLRARDPAGMVRVAADVEVVSATYQGMQPRARIGGSWYRTALDGPGLTGDLYAEMGLIQTNEGLRARALIFRCENASCGEGTTVWEETEGFGAPATGQRHALAIAWDGSRFTFELDDQVITHQPQGIAIPVGARQAPLMQLGTTLHGAGGSGEIDARFDNVDLVRGQDG